VNVRSEVFAFAGIALVAIAVGVAVAFELSNPRSGTRRLWDWYLGYLDSQLRFLFYDIKPQRIANYQILGFVAVGLLAALLRQWILLAAIPLVGIAPVLVLWKRRRERIDKIEQQLDSWLMILANALKATPSLGEALANSARIVQPPIQQELDICLKEIRLGSPIDEAVVAMSRRVGSRTVAGALATILVGRQTGGDLPHILEKSSETLREMARLEGIVRTKTAEGKSQAYVLSLIPFALLGSIHYIDDTWLKPLWETTLGYILIVSATILWLAAVFLARKILAVDV
jgi:tight adherence protein B